MTEEAWRKRQTCLGIDHKCHHCPGGLWSYRRMINLGFALTLKSAVSAIGLSSDVLRSLLRFVPSSRARVYGRRKQLCQHSEYTLVSRKPTTNQGLFALDKYPRHPYHGIQSFDMPALSQGDDQPHLHFSSTDYTHTTSSTHVRAPCRLTTRTTRLWER